MPTKIDQALQFINTLFVPGDIISIRPIETWDDKEDGKRKSKVDRKGMKWYINGTRDNSGIWKPAPQIMRVRIEQGLARHLEKKTNFFFGVCPRFGGDGQYENAWQIRIIRCLWMDIDDCPPNEALLRCEQNKIPRPSITINSGNGTHLYWVLDEPFAIDDCKSPIPTHGEFVEKDGKKRYRSYILDEQGEKLHLDVASNKPKLSNKGQYIQDIINGMAVLIGGDHTKDVSRILRIPGSMNQKNARNGKEPKPCELTELREEKYGVKGFERFLSGSPDRKKRERMTQIPLPVIKVHKPGSKLWDKLNEYIAMSAVAETGQRSEPDFHLLCFCVEQGISRSESWGKIQNVGKFAERGEEYFDRTWNAAEEHTREKTYDTTIAKRNKAAARVISESSVNGNVPIAETNGHVAAPDPLSEDRKLCQELRIDVLGELPGGGVKVFSEHYGKTVILERVVFQTPTDLLQRFGPVVRERIHEGKEPIPGMFQLKTVRDAIALLGGLERAGQGVELGQGVWRGTEKIVLVNPKAASVWDGKTLEMVRRPRVAGLKIDMDFPEEWKWFEHEKLAKYLVMASDHTWCEAAITEISEILEKWYWRQTIDVAAELVAGLILATFVQSCWTWRPLVAITASSDSGKTMLLETLQTIFGGLSLLNAKSTEAGIRQAVGMHSKVILCDEFESDSHRKKILEFFRTSSRGSKTLRGTSAQQSQEYGLRHIPWAAAIEIGLERAPDRNRFIMLELDPPPRGARGKITLPSEPALVDLGQRLLAVAVRYVAEADAMAMQLKNVQFEGIHGRVVESFAVPMSIIAVACGQDLAGATGLLKNTFEKLDQDPAQATKDETELLGDIFDSEVSLGRGEKASVSQIINKPAGYPGGWDAMERAGVVLVGTNAGSRPESNPEHRKAVFIAYRSVMRYLLRGTRWVDQSVDQLLRRIPGAKKVQRRIGGHRPWGIDIPWSFLSEKFFQDEDDDESTTSSDSPLR